MDDLDSKLMAELRDNARQSVSDLARKLKLARATVQDRMTKMEQRGVIAGYTVKPGPAYVGQAVRALVMLKIDPKRQNEICARCQKLPGIVLLETIAGDFDLSAQVAAETTGEIDQTIDALWRLEGVHETLSSIILSTKIDNS